MSDFKANDQVVYRKPMVNGAGILIKTGSILRVLPDGMAQVHFTVPVDTIVKLPMTALKHSREEFNGRARVNPNPVFRGIA